MATNPPPHLFQPQNINNKKTKHVTPVAMDLPLIMTKIIINTCIRIACICLEHHFQIAYNFRFIILQTFLRESAYPFSTPLYSATHTLSLYSAPGPCPCWGGGWCRVGLPHVGSCYAFICLELPGSLRGCPLTSPILHIIHPMCMLDISSMWEDVEHHKYPALWATKGLRHKIKTYAHCLL